MRSWTCDLVYLLLIVHKSKAQRTDFLGHVADALVGLHGSFVAGANLKVDPHEGTPSG